MPGPYPPQPPYGQQPPPYGVPPMVPPPKKKSNGGIIALLIGGVILAMCLVCGVGGSIYLANGGAKDGTSSSSGTADGEPAGGLNQKVTDGDLEWTVVSGSCGQKSVGYVKAADQFCIYQATVKNTGSAGVQRGLGFYRVYDAAGKEYQYNALASSSATTDDPRRFEPGATANLSLVFDVPTGTTPTKILLRDNTRQDGVTVSLK